RGPIEQTVNATGTVNLVITVQVGTYVSGPILAIDVTFNSPALLGQTVVDHLFEPGEDPIGATIRVKNVPFEVIGILARKGQTGWGQDQDDVVVMPFSTAERRVLGTQILGTVDMIFASTATAAAIPEAERQIRALLHERHHI